MRTQQLVQQCSWILLCTAAITAQAQNISGTISGTVHDPAGASVPNATITITNTDRHAVLRTVPADAKGFYTAPQLPIGHYSVSVEASGFQKSTTQGITLNVNDKLAINPTLALGSATQSVTVNAAALQVDTESATTSTLIDATQIAQLPLNNRNYEQLVQLQPGTVYGGGDQLYIGLSNPSGQTNQVSYSINGLRNSQNNWTVDGADNVDRGSNVTLLIYPSIDAIAEFKTLRSVYSAEFGRTASGQVNVVTKSGTHDFHGSAYEFFRNDVLNANTYLQNQVGKPRLPLRYNDFGYSIGGPVWIPKVYNTERNKTFFFFSQEFRRVITNANPVVLSGDPTAAERAGTFPVPVCLDNACTNRSTQVPITSPLAQAYLKDVWSKIPEPDNPATNTYNLSQSSTFNARQEIARIDHTFTQNFAAFFRFEDDSIPTIEPSGLFSGSGFPGVGTTQTNSPGRNYLGHVTYTLSPTFIFDAGYALSRGAIISNPTGLLAPGNSPDIKPTLPFPVSLARLPTLSFLSAGGTNLTSFGPYRDFNNNHNVFFNFSKTLGQQSLRWGGTYNHYEKTENSGSGNAGSFTFLFQGSTPADQKSNPVFNFQQAFANFLMGNVNSFTQASQDLTPDINANLAEGYLQDDWKVLRNLTLNIGMRYSWFQQPIDNNHQLTNFDPSVYSAAAAPTIDTAGNICTTGAACKGGVAPNPNGNRLNGLSIANQNSPYGSKVAPQAWLNFAPRFGFAYDVFGDGKLAVRGGYGLAYDDSAYGNIEDNVFGNPPYVSSIAIPSTSFDNPGGGAASVSSSPLTLSGTPFSRATPYSQEFSLGIQQEFAPSLIGEINYVGTTGTHLLGIADINELQPGAYLSLGIPAGGVKSGTITQSLNQLRPYKGYGPINSVLNVFTSNYNGLQMSLKKRFSDGSLFDVNYTWSKAMTNALTDRTAIQDAYDIAANYGRSTLNRTHVFSFDSVYNLPIFRNRGGVTGSLLGGWQVAAIVLANSGLPSQPSTSNVDPAGLGFLGPSLAGPRPDQVSDPNSGAPHTFAKWFNTAAFQNVPTDQVRIGNARTGGITLPGFQRWDIALYKGFKFGEKANLQFRAESFNTFNHTNLDTINASLVSSLYGQVTGTRDPRLLQLALKMTF